METRAGLEDHERANRETEEHLQRMEEFLAQSRRKLDALRDGVARTHEHVEQLGRSGRRDG